MKIKRNEYLFDNNQAKNGNIHKVIYDNTNVTEFQYNEMNELTEITHPDSSTETLTYDNNGNLIQTTRNGETTTYQWDCFDRLKKVTLPPQNGGAVGETVDFNYDEDGMLVKMDSEGTEQKFTQKGRFATRELVKNSQGNWETTATHIIFGEMLSSYISPASNKKANTSDVIFYHTDHIGSVRLITDSSGNIVSSSFTDSYGNPLPMENASNGKSAKILSTFNFQGANGMRYVEKVKLHNKKNTWYENAINEIIEGHTDAYEKITDYYMKPNQPIIPPTKENETKLQCILKILKKLCPKQYNRALWVEFKVKPFPKRTNTMAIMENGDISLNTSYWESKKDDNTYWAYILMEEMIHLEQYYYFKYAKYKIGFKQPFPKKQNFIPTNWTQWLENYDTSHPHYGGWALQEIPGHDFEAPDNGKVVMYETLAALAINDELSRINHKQTKIDSDHRLRLYHPWHSIAQTNEYYDPYSEIITKVLEYGFNNNTYPYLLSKSLSPKEAYDVYCK